MLESTIIDSKNSKVVYRFSVLVVSFLLAKQGKSVIKGGAWL